VAIIEKMLAEKGYTLPEAWKFPSPNRRGCVRVENILFLSGHGPHHPGMEVKVHGKLGADISVAEGYESARAAALMMLATVKKEVGDLDRVKRIIRLFGMVNCTADFSQMPGVIDGASDLFLELWGSDYGCHARSAVGMVNLPRGQAIEINGEFEIRQ
jgi:enamine deaminase RidA (YjgF/YER057c/UK114 family)